MPISPAVMPTANMFFPEVPLRATAAHAQHRLSANFEGARNRQDMRPGVHDGCLGAAVRGLRNARRSSLNLRPESRRGSYDFQRPDAARFQWPLAGRRGSYDLPSPYDTRTLTSATDFGELGLRVEEAERFQAVADKQGWDIFVRSGNMARTKNAGLPGLRPKPAGVYQKTSKDAYLPGLVMYPEQERSRATEDVVRIRHPHEDASPSEVVLAMEGLSLADVGGGFLALRDEASNFIYGDIDIHGVYEKKGDAAVRIPADTFVPLLNAALAETGLHSPDLLEPNTVARAKEFGVLPHSPIQHGAHDEWTHRSDPEYAGGINMGPLPGVIHFRPGIAAEYMPTVPQYRDVLQQLGVAEVYSPEAWAKGRNRSQAAEIFRRRSMR